MLQKLSHGMGEAARRRHEVTSQMRHPCRDVGRARRDEREDGRERSTLNHAEVETVVTGLCPDSMGYLRVPKLAFGL